MVQEILRFAQDGLHAVLTDTFAAAERRLRKLTEQMEGDIKRHPAQEMDGVVDRIVHENGYGFIRGLEGTEYFFHRNSVLHDDFERLTPGTGVRLVAGALKLHRALRFRGLPGFGVSLAGAVLLAAAGIALLVYPWEGVAVLTLVLVVLFLLEGVGEVGFAFQCRDLPVWGWILASGVASLVIALLLLFHWPSSATWAIGLLVGINLLFTGAWLLAMGSALRHLTVQ